MLAVFTVNSMLDGTDGSNTTLREAIDAAANSLDPQDIIKFDETVFANGGTILLTQGQLSISASDKIIIDGRDTSGNPLDITIDASGSDPTPTQNNGDGSRIFKISSAGNLEVEINSLTLTGGDLPSGADPSGGGAISCEFSSLTVKNSVIVGNASQGSGGAIRANSSNLTIENSTIHNNTTTNFDGSGGGVFFAGGNELHVLSNSIISGNTASNAGGGIWCYSRYLSASVQSSLITGNEAATGSGGGLYFNGLDLTMHSTTIRDNEAGGGHGGGLFANALSGGSITMGQSTIDSNKSTFAYSLAAGAFVYADSSAVTITNTTITNNEAVGPEVNVGGLTVGVLNDSNVLIDDLSIIGNHADDDVGGLYIFNNDSTVTVRHTTISGNTAHQNEPRSQNAAGGVWVQALNGAQTTIESSTISANKILTPPNGTKFNAYGGGLFIQGGAGTTTIIRNSTISGNEAEGSGGGIKIAEHFEAPQGGQVSILHCTITNNRADSDGDSVGSGGGIHVGNSATTVLLDHTIVAGNFQGTGSTRDDIKAHVDAEIEAVWSLIGDGTDANLTDNGNNQIGTSSMPIIALLHELADNGGPTETHALLVGSPALDTGNPSATGVPTYDQRGAPFGRVVNGDGVGSARIDIGAFEATSAMVCVSTTVDELDADLSHGDFSLREAVAYANAAGVPLTICLPEDEYDLTHAGGDLDITGDVTIIGDGPGLSIIYGDNSSYGRILDVAGSAVLNISRVTLAIGHGMSNSDQRNGGAIRVQNDGELNMDTCAVVGNESGSWGLGGAIYFDSTASGSIESSVITVNYADQQTGGLYLADSGGTGGTITIKSTIIASNSDGEETDFPDIYIGTNRTLDSEGSNRFTTNPAGPGVYNAGTGDYVKPANDTVHYVVTSIADTHDGSPSPINMSLRDAIDLANTTAGAQEIWLPAWDFALTRVRLPDDELNVADGDLEITQPLTIRGINGWTSVSWAPGLPSDKVFELVGDYNFDGAVNNADGVACDKFQGYSGSNLPWDGNDDGTVNELDEALVVTYFGTSLTLDGIL